MDNMISHRALRGDNEDDLWLIPIELSNKDEFKLSAESRFVRTRGGSYRFCSWERKDGEAAEAPGMIYAMGHIAHVVPVTGEVVD
jgi:hypothetical protein